MKSGFIANTTLLSLLLSGYVWRDDHCSDPVSDWQPRETLRQQGRAQVIRLERATHQGRRRSDLQAQG